MRIAATACCLAMALLSCLAPAGLARSRLEIHMLDVGYGQSLLIRLPDRRSWLVDGGLGIRNNDLLDRLRRLRVRRLDRVICTHPHPDHVEGLVGILERIETRRVDLNHHPTHPRFYPPLLDLLRRLPEVEWGILRSGETIQASPEVTLGVLHPESISPTDPNASSLVFLLQYRRFRFLQGGDIPAGIQEELARSDGDRLACQVAYIPHHGGHGAEAFIQAARPRVALVSVGPNSWGPPDPETLESYRREGALVLRTDRDGEVRIRTDGQRVKVRSEKSGHRLAWEIAAEDQTR